MSVPEQTGWRVRGENGAAEILGLKATTLEARMSRLGIKRSAGKTQCNIFYYAGPPRHISPRQHKAGLALQCF
jgi:hypothetical protein